MTLVSPQKVLLLHFASSCSSCTWGFAMVKKLASSVVGVLSKVFSLSWMCDDHELLQVEYADMAHYALLSALDISLGSVLGSIHNIFEG